MRVVWTQNALRDLADTFEYQTREWPMARAGFETRLSAIERRIASHPLGAQEVEGREGVRAVPFLTYPYRLFYRVNDATIEILHVRHAARKAWKD